MATARTAGILAAILLVAFLARWSEGGGEAALPSAEGRAFGTDVHPVQGRSIGVPSVAAPFEVGLQADRASGKAPLVLDFLLDVDGDGVAWSFDADGDGKPESEGNGTTTRETLVRYATPGVYMARLVGVRDAVVQESVLKVEVTSSTPAPVVRVTDRAGDARTSQTDLRWFEARSQDGGLEVTIAVASLGRTGPAGSSATYSVAIDGATFSSFLADPTDAAPATTDARGASLPDGTSRWDEERGTVHFRLPESVLRASGVTPPFDIVARSVHDEAGLTLSTDRAPDSGSALLHTLEARDLLEGGAGGAGDLPERNPPVGSEDWPHSDHQGEAARWRPAGIRAGAAR